jgi:hypothetical protein
MVKKFLFVGAALALLACVQMPEQAAERTNFTVEDFQGAARMQQIRHLRVEFDRRASERHGARIMELYLGKQQFFLVQAPMGSNSGRYRQLYEAHVNQGWTTHERGNMLLVIPPETPPEILLAFEQM